METEGETLYGWLRIAGGLGMATFFGCLVVYDRAAEAPGWLVWPAFAAMLIGVFGGLLLEWRRGERRGATVIAVLLLAVAAFVAGLVA